MPESKNIEFSVLDLVPILENKTPADSFKNALDLAQHVEQLGFKRFWLAEHHNMLGVASVATSVLIGYIAAGTEKIRVGSGGVMLPNHAPLVIAEQFGTLGAIYPDRIDLGLGRAPGTDQLTAAALRRQVRGSEMEFPDNVKELMNYFLTDEERLTYARAVVAEGVKVPVWLLGSSTYSAQLAAILGLPFAFASHFAPTNLHEALTIYRERFQPSRYLQEPYVLACVNGVAADTDNEAQKLATSLYQFFLGVIRGNSQRLQPPVDQMDGLWTPFEREAAFKQLEYAFIGSKQTIKTELQAFVDETQVDELMFVSHIYDQKARLHSYDILSELRKEISK
ncbi:LLM class flavin-dependent oxidoreductase [Heyndrickxia ginsengihumi]|uniref:LLM class flavin-dependent oxidoreductase n=1 Tax=Heyndrickxia ginsengihumi TaxID=363870 RepID=A0A0A6VGR3_9BACI|nr:LLM class flavin-dependent oxidoreductase [Heyndrickxia ginsengihumi]KHD86638.1 luciferase [Heyndrickxia ginsengihumi]MBE6185200.1 LLM class flavin-dependent oxidoreductase [Bacillus sp. (in: firmicutes)]MCM3022680.1 LLM class flavin-dependent oxidoreductase [Heyndrickxia ginsengihumi]NEY18982.1 LLM class flavin-dependent oxidoreductase [Heyndrickxia ginsengihumi]